jgi:hypothetical protein
MASRWSPAIGDEHQADIVIDGMPAPPTLLFRPCSG